MPFSANVSELEGSATLAVTALCRRLRAQGRDVLDLSAGEPDFRTPVFAAEAGIAAIEQGYTQYAPVAGIQPLRDAIAQHLGRTYGRTIDPAGVVVSTGAKQALFNACFSLFGPGDEVLIPVPYWTSYPEIVKLSRARPVFVPPGEAASLRITPADLERAAGPSTRGLLLNSPSNPTGVVYSLSELEAIMRWAAERGITVVSDEIYGRICFTAERAPGILDLPDALLGDVVLVDGASKAFAMTGWRVGFSWSDKERASTFADLQSQITSGANTPAQHAALAVYRDDYRVTEAVHAMVQVFHRRRDAALAALHQFLPELNAITPDGAFFLFLRVDSFYQPGLGDSHEFCHWLLDNAGVALVPGAAFGDDRCVRLSYASPEESIVEGIRRMAKAVRAAAEPVGI
jgi:aspartate aminotransferase